MFLDNASTTKINKESLEIFNEYSISGFYNPSALYKNALEINSKLNSARQNFLKFLGGNSYDNFIFTSGATEANNTVINTVKRFKKGKFLFSVGEHPSVYNCALNLINEGYNVEFIKLTKSGVIDLNDYSIKLTPDVVFVSIMHVNNETGAINPIKKCVQMAKQINSKVLFHCDGVQAFGKIKVNVKDLNVDFYTISGHKIHGPKGVGGLFVKKDVFLKPLLAGGGQEFNLRSGTENVPGILAFEKSAELIVGNLEQNLKAVTEINNKVKTVLNSINDCVVISDENCSPYIIAFSISDTRAETLLHMLDDEEIIIGNGSACSSKKSDNRVLSNCGYDKKIIEGSLRISFSSDNVNDDFELFEKVIKNVINTYKGNVKK